MPGSPRPLDPWDVLLTGPRADVLRVGLAVPLSGPLALTAPSALDLAGLAAEEANAAGGVRGREVQLVAVDSGRAPAVVAAEVTSLFAAGAFDVLVGFHTSDVHRALEAALPAGARYVYTPPHEGGRRRPGVVRTGVSPLEQHAAALRWLVHSRRARRWVLLGTDYVWPRAVHRAARRVLADAGAEVAGEALVPFGPSDVGPLLDLVRRTRADGVLLSMVGRDLVTFNREFARAGLDRGWSGCRARWRRTGCTRSGATAPVSCTPACPRSSRPATDRTRGSWPCRSAPPAARGRRRRWSAPTPAGSTTASGWPSRHPEPGDRPAGPPPGSPGSPAPTG
ncbi:ABC transporter substrate-binding protein [Blastococcus xanthinilyticus]|uniref:ABC transporter substrate-binding protein n=1 Tax=Blastococcus xanthinilyticus TaxID=1564164 RepID=UPI00141274FE|nr:ABC transporter substrate-binding protein [Blastococcus xanthinilyticus]